MSLAVVAVAKRPDNIGRRLDQRIASVIAKAGMVRSARRMRWQESVLDARMSYSRVRNYSSPPIMEHGIVKYEIHEMLKTAIEGRLTIVFMPILVRLERIETSIEIVKILASPSGRGGPESYAPKSYREAIRVTRSMPAMIEQE